MIFLPDAGVAMSVLSIARLFPFSSHFHNWRTADSGSGLTETSMFCPYESA
jgi:hypothetical protein